MRGAPSRLRGAVAEARRGLRSLNRFASRARGTRRARPDPIRCDARGQEPAPRGRRFDSPPLVSDSAGRPLEVFERV